MNIGAAPCWAKLEWRQWVGLQTGMDWGDTLNIANTLLADKETSEAGGGGGWLCNTEGNPHTITLWYQKLGDILCSYTITFTNPTSIYIIANANNNPYNLNVQWNYFFS